MDSSRINQIDFPGAEQSAEGTREGGGEFCSLPLPEFWHSMPLGGGCRWPISTTHTPGYAIGINYNLGSKYNYK